MLSTAKFCSLARCSTASVLPGSLSHRNVQARLPRLSQARCLNTVDVPTPINPIFVYFSNTYATQFIETGIIALQSIGFSNIGSYVAAGLALRVLTAPLMIYSEHMLARRIHAVHFLRKKILEKVGAHYGVKVVPSNTSGELTLATQDPKIIKHANEMVAKNINEHSMRNGIQAARVIVLRVLPAPLWIYSSFAIRNMINVDYTPVAKGFLWIQNLNVPDPYYVFPICVGLVGLLSIQSQRVLPKATQMLSRRVYDVTAVVFMCIAATIMTKMPACIPIYWLAVSTSGLAQNLLLRHPTIKRHLGIGKLPTDTSTPVRDLFLLRKRDQASIF